MSNVTQDQSELKVVSVQIPEDLWRRAKAAAVLQGVELRQFVAAALTERLANNIQSGGGVGGQNEREDH